MEQHKVDESPKTCKSYVQTLQITAWDSLFSHVITSKNFCASHSHVFYPLLPVSLLKGLHISKKGYIRFDHPLKCND